MIGATKPVQLLANLGIDKTATGMAEASKGAPCKEVPFNIEALALNSERQPSIRWPTDPRSSLPCQLRRTTCLSQTTHSNKSNAGEHPKIGSNNTDGRQKKTPKTGS
ncbi:hypothetical protein A9Q89_01875 [Gammaproteobacteria bacterium 53_120_T64]|nr:hypothetical protein A9Q89_01875 [Gammaproteobacteria bacterium 53_120_T64]